MNNAEYKQFEKKLSDKPRSNFKKNWREWLAGYLMLLPNFIGFFIFMLIPIVATIYIGFTNWDLINVPKWVGFLNYQILFRDPIFWISLKKTVIFTLVNVPIQSFLALLVAILLNQKLKGLNLFRTLFIAPWICMPVAIGLTWTWMYNKDFGYINHLMTILGLAKVGWLSSQELSLFGCYYQCLGVFGLAYHLTPGCTPNCSSGII